MNSGNLLQNPIDLEEVELKYIKDKAFSVFSKKKYAKKLVIFISK